ncbi:MAG: hypothetical protein H0W95_03095 [Nocardioidaceae bacterium]|nr:hypothetical protein [Nocardioidaceae bacterium]
MAYAVDDEGGAPTAPALDEWREGARLVEEWVPQERLRPGSWSPGLTERSTVLP